MAVLGVEGVVGVWFCPCCALLEDVDPTAPLDATTVGDEGYGRSEALIAAGADVIVVDTAHGHSARVADAVTRIKKLSNKTQVIAGNVATAAAAMSP